MLCAAACHSTVGRTIFESLAVLGDDGEVYPYLLESFEPNDDYTVWTLVVRDGIKFHDGTDLDADAVATNLDLNRAGAPAGGKALVHDAADLPGRQPEIELEEGLIAHLAGAQPPKLLRAPCSSF